MKLTIFSILPLIFACGEDKTDTADTSDTATQEPVGPDSLPDPDIPTCIPEEGSTISGFVGRLDFADGGTSKVYTPEERIVAVFQVLQEEDTYFVEGNYLGFGIDENLEPLYQVQSGSDGCYSLNVPLGEYSIVSSIGDGWLCGESTGICEVSVQAEKELNFVWDNTVLY